MIVDVALDRPDLTPRELAWHITDTHDYFVSVPLRFLPELGEDDPRLALLRQRFVLLASGEGRAEAVQESWNMARILGDRKVPNWVDSWGPSWHHDWETWREMLPKYLGEWTS